MVLIDEIRKLFEEVLLPELRNISARLDLLTNNQAQMAEDLANAQKEMETKLINQLRQSEMNILRSIAADLSSQNEELRKRLNDEKDEPPTVQ